jgi:hypothetical protein
MCGTPRDTRVRKLGNGVRVRCSKRVAAPGSQIKLKKEDHIYTYRLRVFVMPPGPKAVFERSTRRIVLVHSIHFLQVTPMPRYQSTRSTTEGL